MTEPPAPPAPTGLLPPPEPMRLAPAPAARLRTVLIVVVVLAVIGAALGLLWLWWSPPRPIGFVIAPHAVQPDETEAFVASDGRFAALTALAGIGAAIAVWFLRSLRGPAAVLALAIGGVLGAWSTELVGHALGGGSATGPNQTLISHLPLQLHMGGLLVIEAAVAVLAYGLFVAFAASDDLDVDGPGPSMAPGSPLAPDAVGGGSVGFGGEPEHGWSHGDAPGALQQPDLAP